MSLPCRKKPTKKILRPNILVKAFNLFKNLTAPIPKGAISHENIMLHWTQGNRKEADYMGVLHAYDLDDLIFGDGNNQSSQR